jgi:hypothetical protein
MNILPPVGGYDALHDGTGAEFRVHVGLKAKVARLIRLRLVVALTHWF